MRRIVLPTRREFLQYGGYAGCALSAYQRAQAQNIINVRKRAAAGGSTAVTDNFNRASIGSNWTAIPNQDNLTIYESTNVYTGQGYWSANSFSANQYSSITWVVGNGGDVGLILRAQTNAETYYLLWTNGGTTWRFYKFIDGTPTQIGTDITHTFSNSEVIRFEISGTTLRAYYDATQLGTDQTDSSIASGYPGIWISTESVAGDDWAGGDL